MSKQTKIWLIIAISLVLIGSIIFGGVMTVLKWDFTKLSTVKYETNEYNLDENYKNISIVTDTADVIFVASENSKSSVACYEQKNTKHSVSVKDDTLVIEITDTRKWYEYIGVNFGTQKITVYIPQAEYGVLSIKSSTGDIKIPNEFKFENIDIKGSTGTVTNFASATQGVKIKTSTGNICVENISANTLDLTVSTGKITADTVTCVGDINISVSTGKTNLNNIKCESFISSGSTGNLVMTNTVAQNFCIKRSTGDVNLDGCDASEIFVETDTGNVSGTLLSDKVFITKTDTGSINVPKTSAGGKCEIITDTGNIKIDIIS